MAHLEGAELSADQIIGRTAAGHADRPGPPGAVRLEPATTSASSGCSTRSLPTCPARSTSRRSSATIPRRGPRSRASPAPTSRSAGWCSRSPTTPTATCRSCGSTRAGSSRAAGSYNPGKDKKENCSRLYHIRADRPRADPARRSPATSSASSACKDSITGDTLCDAAAPDPAGADRVPRDGHQHVDRAGQLGRQGEAGRDA